MRSVLFFLPRALVVLALVVATAAASSASAQNPDNPPDSKAQEKDQKPKGSDKKEPQISDGERQLLNKINAATDNTAKLQAAAEYSKKYPKSSMRPQVIKHISAEIARVPDPAQQIALAENFVTIFTGPGESDLINRLLIEIY
ncbi:MAG TPA: hypothetical protein VNH22_16710, partial [Blastocatellia bacterium]|nr:hypothetical protein [Blastocatellia bacterium]